MSFPSFANPSPGEFLRDARGNPLPDPGLWVVKHVERLERENAALREELVQMRSVINEMADRFGRPEFKTHLFDDFMQMRRDVRRDRSASKEAQP